MPPQGIFSALPLNVSLSHKGCVLSEHSLDRGRQHQGQGTQGREEVGSRGKQPLGGAARWSTQGLVGV
jgi:hypothetical protein